MTQTDFFEDRFHRRITYLRVSVTDQCNLRCIYCMPKDRIQWKRPDEILRFEQIVKIIAACAELGINKVRITGGEPLVRRDIAGLVGMIRQDCGVEEICMTTNATLLEQYAAQLKRNGLDRLNISLDTLDPAKFATLTRSHASLDDIFRGVEAAMEAGFDRIKFNIVVIRGLNDDEIESFVEWAATNNANIRFIELMPTGTGCFDHKSGFIDGAEIKSRIERVAGLVPVQSNNPSSAAAEEYQIEGSSARIGFIRSVSQPFCGKCNRLRLTADGLLKPCLYSNVGIDLMPDLKSGIDRETLKSRIRQVALAKPKGHKIGKKEYCFAMNCIGG